MWCERCHYGNEGVRLYDCERQEIRKVMTAKGERRVVQPVYRCPQCGHEGWAEDRRPFQG
jgi:hypothetical protein